MQRSDSPTASVLRFVSFARPYRFAAALRGDPKFLKIPCVRALLYDPGGAVTGLVSTCPWSGVACGFPDTLGLLPLPLRGSITRLDSLAVYAS